MQAVAYGHGLCSFAPNMMDTNTSSDSQNSTYPSNNNIMTNIFIKLTDKRKQKINKI